MGSRKIRLANEALRQQQAITAANERITDRLTIASDVEKLLNDFEESHQAISQEQANNFKEYYQERQAVEANRKLEVLAGKKTRLEEVKMRTDEVAALIHQYNVQRLDMAKEQNKNLTEHIHSLMSQNLFRYEQAQSEKKARREFLFETLDLDFG